jgi:hypothetical protein
LAGLIVWFLWKRETSASSAECDETAEEDPSVYTMETGWGEDEYHLEYTNPELAQLEVEEFFGDPALEESILTEALL